ncbi:rubrerythrin [bacterium BMS3Abin03]|nr:rubrerythrin [bacterium BMS3Abin03]MCG6960319.1 rubrerythrin [bacterium BMS3Abin03]
MKSFHSLTEQEILALAISQEEEDARIYDDIAEGLRANFPEQANEFMEMRKQEDEHRHRLLDLYRSRFGEHIPHIRRQDVRGFVDRKPLWRIRPMKISTARKMAEQMELETRRFYETAAKRTSDAGIRQLLGDLAAEEREHIHTAQSMEVNADTHSEQETQKRLFLLQIVQPGLVGLMDGSVSTLAPLFAAAFATHNSFYTFLIGLAAAIGAGISMGFAEALSDDGTLTGRGHPWMRGAITGLMTTLGGLGHTLPYLISDVYTATTVAIVVVFIELFTIAWIRNKYMDTPLGTAVFQVVIGGILVFLSGILIGIS